ncbi:hypothetical protein G3570_05905 [Balneolaceae bacterium YR4-1]|uniref:Cbb3-type cytochrome oxidase assembly protein CcoS n=1 Tax=Halalkalibaculum roseum TaxID=2709311 RepID=A0A6M1SVK5_9BACT|nr:hypothetical protein [Halalkalibaculum roseum]NGP76156.1 hypothetical protein [Halalkalibaculum roseum]
MTDYLLLFGLLVVVLFFTGVFLSITEFREMTDNPDKYSRKGDAGMDIKKNS